MWLLEKYIPVSPLIERYCYDGSDAARIYVVFFALFIMFQLIGSIWIFDKIALGISILALMYLGMQCLNT